MMSISQANAEQDPQRAAAERQMAMHNLMLANSFGQAERDAERERQAAAEREAARQREIQRQRAEAEARRQAAEAARISAYNFAIQSATTLASQGHFAAAIQQFEIALNNKPGDVFARFNIACCNEAIGQIQQALKVFRDLQGHAGELAEFGKHLNNCIAVLQQQAQEALNASQEWFKQGNKLQSITALNAARELAVNLDNSALQNAIEDFARFLHWDDIRNNVNDKFASATQKIQQGEFRVALELLRDAANEYQQYARFLTAEETTSSKQLPALLQQATRAVEKLDNIARHDYILQSIPTLRTYLLKYDLDAAQKLLNVMNEKSHAITRRDDITGCIQPTVFENSLQQLSDFIKEFKARKASKANEAAQLIAAQVMDNNKLSSTDYDFMVAIINNELQKQWVALDRRDLTQLIPLITKTIQDNLQPNGCLTACCTGAAFYIADTAKTENAISATISANLPQDYRAPLQIEITSLQSPQQPLQFLVPHVSSQVAIPVAEVVRESPLAKFDETSLPKDLINSGSLPLAAGP